jgi:LPXTG-motif cell wall-anchored protein
MNCASLPDTGGPAAFWLGVGLLCLVAGGLVLRRRRGGRLRGAGSVALLLVAAGFVVTQPSPSEAANDCGSSEEKQEARTPTAEPAPATSSAPTAASTSGPTPTPMPTGRDFDLKYVTIIQTSEITGLGPSVEPAAIAGTVRNEALDDTYVTDVTVSIDSVTKAEGAPAGECSADDYLLVDPVMSVEQPLPGKATVTFSGASLGFRNTSSNQDACKGATVNLLYVSGSR